MQFSPDQPAGVFATVACDERPSRPYRQRIRSLAYINLDNCNGGILRNIGERGIAVQTIAPLAPDQHVHIRFELLSPRLRMETSARVAWVDAMGQAGLEFVSISARSKKLIKDWIFIQLLSAAHQAAIAEHILAAPSAYDPQNSADGLANFTGRSKTRAPRVVLPWCPFSISVATFAHAVDSIVVLCSVLLFSVVSLLLMNTFPTWPIGVTLLAGVASAFTALYWFLFEIWIGSTPGSVLANVATCNREMLESEEDQHRFR